MYFSQDVSMATQEKKHIVDLGFTEAHLPAGVRFMTEMMSGSCQMPEAKVNFVHDIEDIFVLIETTGLCGLIIIGLNIHSNRN